MLKTGITYKYYFIYLKIENINLLTQINIFEILMELYNSIKIENITHKQYNYL